MTEHESKRTGLPGMNTPKVSIVGFSRQGDPSKNNEDTVIANAESAVAGVCDGASDIVGFKTPDGATGGLMASRIAAGIFAATPVKRSLLEMVADASTAINDAQRRAGIDTSKKANRFCTTAAVARVRYDSDGEEWIDLLQVADSVAIVVYADGRAEAPLGVHDQDEETLVLWSQLADEGLRGEAIRRDPRMVRQLEAKRSESNVTYGVLNGETVPPQFVRAVTISAVGVAKVILITDGMFIPRADRATPHDWMAYARLEQAGGLQAIYDHVRALEASDPELVRYPRFKLHDDASGAVIVLNH